MGRRNDCCLFRCICVTFTRPEKFTNTIREDVYTAEVSEIFCILSKISDSAERPKTAKRDTLQIERL